METAMIMMVPPSSPAPFGKIDVKKKEALTWIENLDRARGGILLPPPVQSEL